MPSREGPASIFHFAVQYGVLGYAALSRCLWQRCSGAARNQWGALAATHFTRARVIAVAVSAQVPHRWPVAEGCLAVGGVDVLAALGRHGGFGLMPWYNDDLSHCDGGVRCSHEAEPRNHCPLL